MADSGDSRLRELLDLLAQRYAELRRITPQVAVEIGKPARKADVHRLKRSVPALPAELEAFFLEGSEKVRLEWELSDDVAARVPPELEGVTSCFFEISLAETQRLGADWQASGRSISGKQLFPLIEMMTGDVIVCANDPAQPPQVGYADHETSEVIPLSESLRDFLQDWFALGCPGPERDALEPFVNPAARRLDLTLPAARTWLTALKFR
jgi:hypothetical protein